jgi:predicted negative regulator of RcsB-dependent stress response
VVKRALVRSGRKEWIMKREEKRKLKEDEFVSIFTWIVNFFESWRREALIGLAVLAGLILIVVGLFVLRGSQTRSASADLGRILELRSGIEKTPGAVAELEALAKKGKFAQAASTQLASYWVEKGELDKAASALAGMKDAPKDFFYYQAKDLAAQIAILKGDPEGGLKILQAIEDAKPKAYSMDAVLFHKAEALEKKGDRAAALALFKKIQTDYAQSYYGYDAGLRAGKLETAK